VRVDLTPGSVSALPLGKSMPPSTAMIVRGPIRGGGNGMFTAYVGGLARNHICSGSNTSRSAAPSADRFKLCWSTAPWAFPPAVSRLNVGRRLPC